MQKSRHYTTSLADTKSALTLSMRANALFAASFVLASLTVVVLVGSAIQPDFWTAKSLIGVWGNAWMLLALVYVAISPLGYSPLLLAGAAHAAKGLQTHLTSSLPRLRLVLTQLKRLLGQRMVRTLTVRAAIWRFWLVRQPQHLRKSKTPIFLFGRAALLLAP